MAVNTPGHCQSLEQQQRQPRVSDHFLLPKKIFGVKQTQTWLENSFLGVLYVPLMQIVEHEMLQLLF